MSNNEEFDVAYEYTLRFYPRWFTWVQLHLTRENSERPGEPLVNRLTGPAGMGPEYRIVVAINDDTIYAQAFLDLSNGPVVLTIPPYANHYSILQVDVYGNVISTVLSENPPSKGGTYLFVASGQPVPLLQGAIQVDMPYSSTEIAIRIDKYSAQGENLIQAANEFRAGLCMQTLAKYVPNCNSVACGRTLVTPLSFYAPSVKLMADEGLAAAPEAFLTTLQQAMASPTTKPLTANDQQLIQRFNALFAGAKSQAASNSRPLTDIIRGAQAAHDALVNRWQSHRGSSNWIHFDNIGNWGTNYLDRAALTEYIQFGNDRKAAYYADAFVDDSSLLLDGSNFAYTIQFAKGELPEYSRFWSMTAYMPGTVELVPNALDKYVVASYTSGLVTAPDGSVTIYVQAEPPRTVNQANWLPIPKSPFSLLFRVYGPKGKALDGTYVPPKIHRTAAR